RIVIGERSNVQDNSTIHTDEGEPTLVGADVTIGHNALVHSSVIARNVLIGQAAVLVGGNVIGEETIVGAGAVLPEKFSPPPGSAICRPCVCRTTSCGRCNAISCAAMLWGSDPRCQRTSFARSSCSAPTRSPRDDRA